MNPSPQAATLSHDLPGSEFIFEGLKDLAEGRETVPSLLIEIAHTRLQQAGVPVPVISVKELDAEVRLYRLLGRLSPEDAYPQYNAHLRRLSSLCRALEARKQRLQRQV